MILEEIKNGITLLCDTSKIIQNCYESKQALVDSINDAKKEDIEKCWLFYENRTGVIVDVRKELFKLLREGTIITVKLLDDLVAKFKEGKENQFRVYKNFYTIFYPAITFYGHNNQRTFVKQFSEQLISDLGLINKVKTTSFDFQGARQQGSDRFWLALYNQEQENQSTGLQFFIEFHHGTMSYGIYQHSTKSYLKNKVTVTPQAFNYEDILSYFNSDVDLLLNDLPKYDNIINIDLENHKLYKISHGTFKAKNKSHIIDKLKENNWIILHENTGKDQSRYFKEDLHSGDYVYITLGSKELLGIAKIVSEGWDYVPNEIVDADGWLFREIEFIKAPSRKSPKDLKDSRNIFPSGNSTLSEIKPELLEEANDKLFKPYFNVEFSLSNKKINVKEKFIDWLVDNVSGGNYFEKQFSSDVNKLREELDLYEIKYKESFDKELFNINSKQFKNDINQISLNIYSKDNTFSEFSKNHFSERPRAILGKNNYISFLNETFSNHKNMENTIESNNFPLNQIIYGPPGTGKTYTLQNKYFDLFTIKESVITREQYLEQVISELNWWQVISIAVLDIGTAKVNSIYDHELVKIKESLSASKTVRPTIWGQLQRHTKLDCVNVNASERSEPLYFNKDEKSEWTIDKNLLKEYFPEAFEILETSKNYNPKVGTVIKNYEFITFHQSFSYEDFIEGIKPKMEENDTDISYEIQDGLFKKLCLKAETDPYNKYALFIDEINRGNISSIFGELITLIEEDKRLGNENELKVKLPYSKKEFGVPSNLYIIGTMNTADRSVEALDSALRRRFSFKELMPNSEVVDKKGFTDYSRNAIMEKINNRIEVLLDRNHTLGHAYFIKPDFKNSFENEIIPLLQEYFYNDYGKIGLILGKGFVREKTITSKNDKSIFADFETKNEVDIIKSYELIPFNEVDFDAAITTLLA
jgi:Cdc6-like AAA superfamily ATPase